MSGSRRLGLFGGTFDPPHLGHLIAAQAAFETLGLDEVLWIPSGEPPHRPGGTSAPGPARIRLVQAAVEGNPAFRVWDGEVRRGGASYTIDTVRALRSDEEAPTEWSLILGADQYRAFGTWKDHEALARLVRLAVVSRNGDAMESRTKGVDFDPVPIPRIDISSSEIRTRRRERRSIRYLVPEGVRRLVEDEDLYV